MRQPWEQRSPGSRVPRCWWPSARRRSSLLRAGWTGRASAASPSESSAQLATWWRRVRGRSSSPTFRSRGYDGSPESRCALATARSLATELDATLAALEVLCFPAQPFGDPVATDRASIEHLVDAARERIRHLGGIEPYAAYGRATEELVIWSAGVDLLVVGSRGFGPVGRLMHGSTAQGLARGTRCPLLVLTRAAPAPGAPDAPDSISAGATAGA